MRLSFADDVGFQRAALASMAAAGVLALFGIPLLPVVAAGCALTIAVWPAGERRLAAGLGVVAGVLLARWFSLRVGALPMPAQVEQSVHGALTGLVASLGLLPLHVRVVRDPVREAFERVRPRVGAEEGALIERARAAQARIDGAASPSTTEARELRAMAGALTLEVFALAERARRLTVEVRAQDGAALERRIDDADAQAATATDGAAADSYRRAARVLRDQRDRLQALVDASDRLRARLHLQVALLESTALAVTAREASATADRAAALAPLVDRLREASAGIHAETEAVAELPATSR